MYSGILALRFWLAFISVFEIFFKILFKFLKSRGADVNWQIISMHTAVETHIRPVGTQGFPGVSSVGSGVPLPGFETAFFT